MGPWFFHSVIPAQGERARLAQREAKHAAGARRMAEGGTVTLFDGQGATAEARIVEHDRRRGQMVVEIVRRTSHAPPGEAVHIVAAVPKGDRAATMLSMCTQLGMTSFRPLQTGRSVVRPSGKAADRWRRILIETCKQCRRPFLPALHEPVDVPTLASLIATEQAGLTLLAHPGGDAIERVLTSAGNPATFIIGPEGGFGDDEIGELTAAGAKPIDLGENILRIETAAVACTAVATRLLRAVRAP